MKASPMELEVIEQVHLNAASFEAADNWDVFDLMKSLGRLARLPQTYRVRVEFMKTIEMLQTVEPEQLIKAYDECFDAKTWLGYMEPTVESMQARGKFELDLDDPDCNELLEALMMLDGARCALYAVRELQPKMDIKRQESELETCAKYMDAQAHVFMSVSGWANAYVVVVRDDLELEDQGLYSSTVTLRNLVKTYRMYKDNWDSVPPYRTPAELGIVI